MPVIPLAAEHVPAVARLHASALAGDFLPSLGQPFLRVFYRTALAHNLAFGFLASGSDGSPAGFVCGSLDTSALFRQVILAAALPLAWAAVPAILRRPALLRNVAETFLYPQQEKAVAEKAELLVIAVDSSRRSQGVGEQLVLALNAAFIAQGVKSYKVTVLQSNAGANRFYQRLGFQPAAQFTLYHKGWNLYLLSLCEEPS